MNLGKFNPLAFFFGISDSIEIVTGSFRIHGRLLMYDLHLQIKSSKLEPSKRFMGHQCVHCPKKHFAFPLNIGIVHRTGFRQTCNGQSSNDDRNFNEKDLVSIVSKFSILQAKHGSLWQAAGEKLSYLYLFVDVAAV